MFRKIKVGQIGIGHNHGSEKMSSLRRLSELYEVVGVVESDPVWYERRHGLKEYEGLRWMTEDELFAVPGLEMVAVETDSLELVPTAHRCADHGLHMHLDKPGGPSLPEFRSLLDKMESRGLAIQLGYMYRNNPAIRFVKDALRQGWLGEIFELHAVMSRWDGDDYRRWIGQFLGGAMYIFGGHLIDLVISMMGRPTDVIALNTCTRDDGCEDNGFAVLTYPRATVSVRTSICEVDGMKHRRLIVCGTQGTAEICPLEHPADRYRLDHLHVRLTLKRDCGPYAAGTHLVEVPLMNGRYDDQITEFAHIIRGEMENPYSYRHEFLVQEALMAACGHRGLF